VTTQDTAILFGRGHRMSVLHPISQIGQYAAREQVRVCLGSGEFYARIVGPERPRTQVEISLTEAKKFGVDPPTTYFGNRVGNRVMCRIFGPRGNVRRRAVIIAQRHIHADPATAKRLGLRNAQIVSVRTHGRRPTTFHGVVVRVHQMFRFRCHLDTDEGNAAGLKGGEWGTIVVGK